MKDFDDEDLEFDDDLPELDLSDLDLEDEDTEASDSKKYELKKYDESLDDSEDFAALIKAEAFKAIDTKDSKASVPSTAVLDEEESDAEYFDYNEEDFDEEEKEKKPSTGKLVGKILLGVFLMLLVALSITILQFLRSLAELGLQTEVLLEVIFAGFAVQLEQVVELLHIELVVTP